MDPIFALAIDWPVILPLVLSILTTLLVVIQLVIMQRQTKIFVTQLELATKQDQVANRQLELAETQTKLSIKQDEIVSEQLSKRAKLHVQISSPRKSPQSGNHVVKVFAYNSGNKSAIDFYWRLLVPRACADRVQAESGEHKGEMMLESGAHEYFKGRCNTPLYSGNRLECDLIEFWNPHPGEYAIKWQITTEDGSFPVDREYGDLTLDFVSQAEAAAS